MSKPTDSGASSAVGSSFYSPRDAYPPYQTRTYQVCPVLWLLDQTWVPVGDDLTLRTMGKAFAVGMAQSCQGHDPNTAAAAVLDAEWTDGPEWTLEGAQIILKKSLKTAIEADLPGRYGSVVAVEAEIGGVRPDLILRGPEGLVIVDWKWHRQMTGDTYLRRHPQQEVDIQLWDYADRVEGHFGERPAYMGLAHVTVNPKAKCWFDPTPIDPERLSLFRHDRDRTWLAMAHDQTRWNEMGEWPAGRWTACLSRDENYGRCRMYAACHDCNRDPQRMAVLYNRREGRE